MNKPWKTLVTVALIGMTAIAAASCARRPARFANPYAPVPGFVPFPEYGAPPSVACVGGYWAHRPVGYDPSGVPQFGPPRYFCP